MSIIAAGTTTTTALSSTGNTDGTLQFQVNGTTASVTLNTLGAIGVGSSPSFGTSGQVLVSAGSTAAPAWATPAAVNLATGVTGTLPITNGGTGTTSTTFANLTTNVTGTLPIANGGTNSTATPTAGTVPYGTGTAFAFTSAGTSGQLLQSNGASAPTWVTASSGAMTLLSTVTASNSATVDIETTFNSTYDVYQLVVSGMTVQSATALQAFLKIGGSYLTTNTYGQHVMQVQSSSAAYAAYVAEAVAQIYITAIDPATASANSMDFIVNIYNPSSTAFRKLITWQGTFSPVTAQRVVFLNGAGVNSNTAALTGIRFQMVSGNIVAGKFRLYGISNS
jgi:hypothetical protein